MISRLYEDNVSGKISDERFAKMTEKFEAEQKNLKVETGKFREKLTKKQTDNDNVDKFVKLAKQAASLENLTPENVREINRTNRNFRKSARRKRKKGTKSAPSRGG